MSGRKLTGARGHFSAAHAGPDGRIHGHTWRVESLWEFDGTDVLERQRALRGCLVWFDHTNLPEDVTLSEDIAEAIGEALGCIRVVVDRPEEGLFAIWEADQ